MASTHRVSRVRELLLRELQEIVQRMRDPRTTMVTVMDVEVTHDLREATMYVSVLGDEVQRKVATDALQNAIGYMRREVAQRVDLRHTPEICVRYDETSERAARVTAIIDSLPDPGEPSPAELSANYRGE
ncbi:MAG: 30S ribosome-binding factor RbfA [Candidatus Latescibacterota bacterium]|nr:30S ribosome-binding factor RbfA [Candidatus Latescibacterota bacterium]